MPLRLLALWISVGEDGVLVEMDRWSSKYEAALEDVLRIP